jgi:hypothetical protein
MSLIGVLAGCDGGADADLTRSDSAGVEIVSATPPSAQLEWRADTVLLLGGKDEGPESFYQVRAELVDVDSAGRIVVLNPVRHGVAVFDHRGRFLIEMGREGEGPGEMRWPLGVAVSHDGTIEVHDASRGVIVRYDLAGRVLPQAAFGFSVISNRLRHLDLTPSGRVLWARDRYTGSDDRLDRLLLVPALGDTVELVAGKPSYTSTADYPRCGMRFTVRIPHSPSIHWSQWGERIAVAVWGEDRVDLFVAGRLARSLRLGAEEPDLSEGDAIRMLEEIGARGPCNTTPREHVHKHGFHPRPQRIRAVAVAPDGALWLRRRVSGRAIVEVYDSTGAPAGALSDAFPMPLTFLPDGRLLVPVRDSLNVERLGIVAVRR